MSGAGIALVIVTVGWFLAYCHLSKEASELRRKLQRYRRACHEAECYLQDDLVKLTRWVNESGEYGTAPDIRNWIRKTQ